MSESVESEINRWLVTSLREQLSKMDLPSSGSKEVLVKRLLAQAACLEAQLRSEPPSIRYQRWGVAALREELQQFGIAPHGGREAVLAELIEVAERKTRPATTENKENTAPDIEALSRQLSQIDLNRKVGSTNTADADAPAPKKTPTQSPARRPSIVAASSPPPSDSSASDASNSNASSPTVVLQRRPPVSNAFSSPTVQRLNAAAHQRAPTPPSGSPTKHETSPLFGKHSPQQRSTSAEQQQMPTAAAAASSSSSSSGPQTPTKPSTPVKSILSPRSKAQRQSMPGSISKQVNWHVVEVREFKRCHGGSLGMPHSGGWSIGLDWEVARQSVPSPLGAYERRRALKRKSTGGDLTPLSEEQRRHLIKKHSPETYHEVEAEAQQIRQSRSRVGCDCVGGECGTSKCLCFANGIACSQDACGCAEDCANPDRDEFDSVRVNEARRARLLEVRREMESERQQQLSAVQQARRATQMHSPYPASQAAGGFSSLFRLLTKGTSAAAVAAAAPPPPPAAVATETPK